MGRLVPGGFSYEMSMRQVLGVWEELIEAYYGHNGFGGDTAELYAYRFLPDNPARYLAADGTKTKDDERAAAAARAATNLYGILGLFCDEHPDCTVSVNGKEMGPWLLTSLWFDHRVHVVVARR